MRIFVKSEDSDREDHHPRGGEQGHHQQRQDQSPGRCRCSTSRNILMPDAPPVKNYRPVRLAYQPPANSTFLSEQISHQQPANSTFLSEQISTSRQPPAERTGCI
jgi:hypothetical protein